jgi:hypothetical protein
MRNITDERNKFIEILNKVKLITNINYGEKAFEAKRRYELRTNRSSIDYLIKVVNDDPEFNPIGVKFIEAKESIEDFIKRKKEQRLGELLPPQSSVTRDNSKIYQVIKLTMMPARTDKGIIYSLERRKVISAEGHLQWYQGEEVIQFAYWTMAQNGNKRGKWTNGESALIAMGDDWKELQQLALKEGTIRPDEVPQQKLEYS